MMRRVLILVLFCSTCAYARGQIMDLKRGSVRQLAFTSDSKQLLVLNSCEQRERVSSEMRLFSIANWKTIAGSGELEVFSPFIALSRGKTCVFGGLDYLPKGFGSKVGKHLTHTVDLPTFKLTKFDPNGKQIEIRDGPAIFACADNKLLFAFTHYGGSWDLHAPFIFDLKTGKKTIELDEFPKRIEKKSVRIFAEFISDGKQVLTVINGNFRLHAADTGIALKTMPVDSQVHAIAISPDEKTFAAYCANGEILLVESDLSKKSIPLKVDANKKIGQTAPFPSLAFVGNGYLALFAQHGVNADSQMEGAEIKLYDTKEWKLRHTFEKKGSWTHCIAGSPDGKWLAAGFGIDGSVPGSVCIWEAATGKLVTEFK